MAIGIGRRQFIVGLSGSSLAWPLAARAQLAVRLPVIGVLSPFKPGDAYVEAFRMGLQELGYVEGRNIHYEFRNGNFDQLHDLAAELVSLNVDVIVAFVTAASLAASQATTTIPIVMAFVSDPVGIGLHQVPRPPWRQHYRNGRCDSCSFQQATRITEGADA